MKVLELRLRNFRQHAETSICFPNGLTGIIGPNGAGKSTLLEAIAWAIYGAEATRGTNETLRNARAGAGARVEAELRFVLADHEYRVVRGLTTAEVQVDGRARPVASTVGAVTEYLQHRLGMVRREFFNTYFTGQKELQFLASMGPTERGRFLSTVLGYDRLRIAQGLVRQRRNMLRNRVEDLRRTLPEEEEVRTARASADAELLAAREAAEEARRTLDEARGRLERVTPRWLEARSARERHGLARAALASAERDAETAAREISRIDEELASIASAEAEQARLRVELAPMPELIRQVQRLDALARTHERRRALAEQVRDIGIELDRSTERLARLEQAPELLRRYAVELAEARTELDAAERELEERKTAWLRDRQDAETKLQSYRDRALELQEEVKRIRSAGRDGRCPTCQRPLGADYERLLASMEEQWAEVTQDGKWWRSRYEQLASRPQAVVDLEERIRNLERTVEEKARRYTRCEAALQELETLRAERGAREVRRDALRAELDELPAGYDAAEHRAAAAAIESLRQVEQRVAALDAVLGRKTEWEEARRVAEARSSEARTRAAVAGRELSEIAYADAAFETLREEADTAERAVRVGEVTVAEAQERLRGAERAAAAAGRSETDLDGRLAEIGRDVVQLRHHNELDSAFTRLRSDLNARVRPELGEIASQLMGQLTDGRYHTLEIDEAYRIVVLEDGVAKPVISGGEEDVANLVLRISLSRMIAERAGHPLSLLVLDEVFGSLDVVRRENVVRLLRRLGSTFDQVLLVTHLEEVRGAMDQVLRVDLDEESGSSVVRWEGKATAEG